MFWTIFLSGYLTEREGPTNDDVFQTWWNIYEIYKLQWKSMFSTCGRNVSVVTKSVHVPSHRARTVNKAVRGISWHFNDHSADTYTDVPMVMYDMQLSRLLYSKVPSRAISHVNMELVSEVSQTAPVSIRYVRSGSRLSQRGPAESHSVGINIRAADITTVPDDGGGDSIRNVWY